MFWDQRSRVKWLSFGDKNSKFFHATTIQRRDRNKLHRLKDEDGRWVEGQSNIMTAVVKYFKEIYAHSEAIIHPECLQVIPNLVSRSMNDALMARITSGEVEKGVFSLGALKSPGPDGLNGDFYQKKNWKTVKRDVNEFFNTGVIGETVNDIVVAHIPKISHPESISHLKPICC